MAARDQIWRNFENAVFKSFLIEEMILVFQKRERWLNIFLALATSASIGAWAVWEKVPLLWAGIIATSNVVVVLKPYFPHDKYLKELREKRVLSQGIILQFERLWYLMQSDKVSESDAMDEFLQIRQKHNEAYTFREDMTLQHDEKIKGKATLRTKNYFKINHSNI